jgi:hypothetical protein
MRCSRPAFSFCIGFVEMPALSPHVALIEVAQGSGFATKVVNDVSILPL